jgi:hypothetical protein
LSQAGCQGDESQGKTSPPAGPFIKLPLGSRVLVAGLDAKALVRVQIIQMPKLNLAPTQGDRSKMPRIQ